MTDDHARLLSPTGARSPAGSSAPAASSASRPSPCTPTPTPTLPFVARGRRRRAAARATPRPRPTCAATWSLEAARRAGADAVHPGYGFLSENADFARAVRRRRADLGRPAAGGDRAMGSKIAAKKLMAGGRRPGAAELAGRRPSPRPTCRCWSRRRPAAAGGACASSARWPTWPREIARPRPRRRRRSATARSSSSRTSSAAGTSRCRSSATRTARCSVLGERDCSIQRRHQKVVEEAPAPGLPDDDARPRCTTRRGRPAERDRLRRRRHGRVPLDAGDRAVLLPGDEHPAPGRAPGHRGGHRPRPGRAAAAGRRGRPTAARRRQPRAARARDRGPALRRGPGRRLAAAERAR